jgi:hypothetical protein
MFPELVRREKDIQEILDEEEESFSRTLDRGEKIFQGYAQQLKTEGGKTLNGADVWRLYDTYGFPVDLTRIMAEEAGLDINEVEFENAQADAKEASKAKKKSGGVELVKLDVHDLGKLENMANVPKTDDRYKYGMANLVRNRGLFLIPMQRKGSLPVKSRPFTITRNLWIPLKGSLQTPRLVFCWTRPTSMRSREVRSTIREKLSLTERPNLRLLMSKRMRVTSFTLDL